MNNRKEQRSSNSGSFAQRIQKPVAENKCRMVPLVEMQLTFEWDEKKAQENARKHRVTFDEARTVFGDPFLWTFSDPDHSRHEERHVSIGLSSEGRTPVVIHTDHESIVRIISGRRAEPKERKAYEEERY